MKAGTDNHFKISETWAAWSVLLPRFKHSNFRIIGVTEGEEEKQEIENLFEKLMKENFPNLRREIDFQEVREAQRVPRMLDPKQHTPKAHQR